METTKGYEIPPGEQHGEVAFGCACNEEESEFYPIILVKNDNLEKDIEFRANVHCKNIEQAKDLVGFLHRAICENKVEGSERRYKGDGITLEQFKSGDYGESTED